MSFQIETLQFQDWPTIAQLIFDSTNGWYQTHRNQSIFQCEPDSVQLFCNVYEAIDAGCCLIARCDDSGRIIGSCFYHPRPTHVGLGIMNVHPKEFGRGVARALLRQIIQLAEQAKLPVRLVSSAMNLDSFSLYTRAGFVPRQLYQDFLISVPPDGLKSIEPGFRPHPAIRIAELADVPAMAWLEQTVAGIRREQDYTHFINNEQGIWRCSVLEGERGLRGWMVSIHEPASSMIGPCVAEDEAAAIELLKFEIDQRRGGTFVFLVPADCSKLVQAAYALGARNCELHVLQVRGPFQPIQGVSMPTFMPETA